MLGFGAASALPPAASSVIITSVIQSAKLRFERTWCESELAGITA